MEEPYANVYYSHGFVHDLAARSPLLRELADSVGEAVMRARLTGAKPPSHVTLPAAEYDEMWLDCGKPDSITVYGVEVRRDPPRAGGSA